MTNKVILGISFIFMLYPFTAEEDEVSTVKMSVLVKFYFTSKYEINANKLNLNLIFAKTKHLNFF